MYYGSGTVDRAASGQPADAAAYASAFSICHYQQETSPAQYKACSASYRWVAIGLSDQFLVQKKQCRESKSRLRWQRRVNGAM